MPQTFLSYLFSGRIGADRGSQPRAGLVPYTFELIDGLVLALYACVLGWAVPHHLPWIDEAQAWLIARDDSLRDMLLRRLHYEGAPPLWHLILKMAIRLHLPYAGFNWLGAAFALAGIFVFLRFTPLPRIFRWLLPFTFYLQYQYAVVARPYVLFPLLLFALCTVFCAPRPRPVLFGVIAGLLANINAHAGILSCVFAVLYLHDLYFQRSPAAERRQPVPHLHRQVALATVVFVVLCCISVATAFPAPDAMVVPTATGRVKHPNSLLVKLLPPERMPVGAPPLDPPMDEAAALRAARMAAPGTVVAPPPPPTLLFRVKRKLWYTVRITADVATFPVAESNALAVLFLVAFAAWLWSRRSLRYLLPWVITTPVAAFIWIYDHHTGMFALALVAAAWISFAKGTPARGPGAISTGTAAIALLVLVLQIDWTAHALYKERRHPYDPGRETAAFLEKNFPGKRIDAFSFQTVSVEPYAQRNLFYNWDHSYWLSSNANPIDLRRTEALERHPDVVVVGDLEQGQDSLYNQWKQDSPAGFHPYEEMILYWQEHGYHETHRFCGTRYMRKGADNSVCELIFERNDRPGS